jgi:ribosome-binding factor A
VSAPRAERLAEQIRMEASTVLAREVHDPGVGFVTLTRVQVTADLQLARLYYTTMGDAAGRQATAKALARVAPFVRRQLGARLQLRRVPEIEFKYDESIAHQARVEELLQDLRASEPSDDASESAPGDRSSD